MEKILNGLEAITLQLAGTLPISVLLVKNQILDQWNVPFLQKASMEEDGELQNFFFLPHVHARIWQYSAQKKTGGDCYM